MVALMVPVAALLDRWSSPARRRLLATLPVPALAILAGAFFVLAPDRLLLSVLGAGIVNLTLAINHKPGRYLGIS